MAELMSAGCERAGGTAALPPALPRKSRTHLQLQAELTGRMTGCLSQMRNVSTPRSILVSPQCLPWLLAVCPGGLVAPPLCPVCPGSCEPPAAIVAVAKRFDFLAAAPACQPAPGAHASSAHIPSSSSLTCAHARSCTHAPALPCGAWWFPSGETLPRRSAWPQGSDGGAVSTDRGCTGWMQVLLP